MAESEDLDAEARKLVAMSYITPGIVIVGVGAMLWLLVGHINGPWHGAAGERHAQTEEVLREHGERLAVVESTGVDDRFRGSDAHTLWKILRSHNPELPPWEEIRNE